MYTHFFIYICRYAVTILNKANRYLAKTEPFNVQ